MAVATSTIIATAAIATVLAAGVGTYSAIASAQAQKDAADFNADVARNQALAEQQKSQFEAQQIRRRNLLRLGEQRAGYAKAGITIESGEDVIYDSALQGELEALSALYGGDTASTYYTTQARLASLTGKNAKTAGMFQAAGTALGGLSSAGQQASKIPDYSKPSGPKIK